MGPGTRCFQYQWVPTANLWVQNTIFSDKSAILLHPGTRRNKNLCAKDAGWAGNKITALITAVRNIFIQTQNTNGWHLCGMFHIVRKNVTFWNEGTFTLSSSVEDIPVILNEMTCRVSARHWLIYISMNFCLIESYFQNWHRKCKVTS